MADRPAGKTSTELASHHDFHPRHQLDQLLRRLLRPVLPGVRPISVAQTARRGLRGLEKGTSAGSEHRGVPHR